MDDVLKITTEAFEVIGAYGWRDACKHVDKVIEQTKAKDHFIDEHEDSFIISLADDSSKDESCNDYDNFIRKRPVKENEKTFYFLCSVNRFLCIIE